MALTFPLAFPSWKVGSLRFHLSRNDLTARDGTGKLSGVTLGQALWFAEFDIECFSDGEALDMEALIRSLQGAKEAIIMSDPRRWYPRAYAGTWLSDGLAATASSYSLNTARDVLTLNGLSNGTILSRGDLIGFKDATGAKRHSVECLESGTVSAGSVAVQVNPAVWASVDAWTGVVAHLDKPSVTMKLTPETEIGPTSPNGQATHRVVAMQVWPD